MGLSSANEIMLAEFLRGERGTALSGSNASAYEALAGVQRRSGSK